ncbi:MAG: class II fructose-bisphosphate aldolase [Patescibacteria group bacterium]
MKTLREYIQDAEDKKIAIGHFNISNLEGVWAVFNAAKKLNVPVIIGVSEGERDFVGVKQIAAVIKTIRDEHQYPIFLNADHTYSFERVKEVVDAGFDAVIIDNAKATKEENIRITKQCVEYAKSVNPNILVEAELGYIGQSSKMLDAIPEGAATDRSGFTTPEDATEFVKATGVDLLAPAVGNIHGMLKNVPNPHLDIELIKEIRTMAGVPLVLHGGSGTSDADFTAAIQAGISTVHINTELRVAYRKGMEQSLKDNADEIAPYKYMKGPLEAMSKVAEDRLKLFNNIA